MIRRLSFVLVALAAGATTDVALLVEAQLAAEAPEGWRLRVDGSTDPADADAVSEVGFRTVGSGFQIRTGPAAVAWNPEKTASGTFTLEGRFTLLAPGDQVSYYGLVYGARDLDGPEQNYLGFLVAEDGSFIVTHQAGDGVTHYIVPRTPHYGIALPGDDGKSVNELEVRAREEGTDFVVNGIVVYFLKAVIQARLNMPELPEMRSNRDGIWGVRVNDRIPGVLVEGLRVR